MIAWDLETERFRTGCLAPPIVCLSAYPTSSKPFIIVKQTELDWWLDCILNQESVGCNIAFDLSCVAASQPTFWLPRIFQALEDELIEDVSCREKLLNLAEHGSVDFVPLPSGEPMRLSYGLAELEWLYLGWDRSADKKGEDAWRTNYGMLKDLPLSKWPEEAIEYSKKDAEGTLLVWEAQETRRQACQERIGCDPLKTQGLRVMLAFCLRLISCQGFPIDPVKVAEVSTEIEQELAPENMRHLIEAKILTPARPGRVYANGRQCKDVPEKMGMKKLREHILEVCEANNVDMTEHFTDKGNVGADKVFLEDIHHLSPLLEEYYRRQCLLTVRNKELPAVTGTTIVYSGYNEMTASGRTTSRGGAGKEDYPSEQVQNLSRITRVKAHGEDEAYEIDFRQTHIARDGWVLYSCDYSSIEFMAVAQKCYELFGHSRMRDLLLAGIDPHADNASGMAYDFDATFRRTCDSLQLEGEEEVREAFMLLKDSPDPAEQKFFKEWRQLAKPFGFGYWGGMGAKRAVETAKKDYGITVSIETAEGFKATILRRHPEMKLWFRFVEEHLQVAPGEFAWLSGFGCYRANASYTDTCNGAMLQTPATGEGAILALTEVTRACYDSSIESCLLGTHVLAFGHDEILGEVPLDGFEHERAHEVARIMVESMRNNVMKDVPVKVEPCLMTRWSKNAKTLYDPVTKRLVAWNPDTEK